MYDQNPAAIAFTVTQPEVPGDRTDASGGRPQGRIPVNGGDPRTILRVVHSGAAEQSTDRVPATGVDRQACADLATLRRPPLLVRAARCGVARFNRSATLTRLFGGSAPARPGAALADLLEIEAECDVARRAGDASYSIAAHVEILIALMAEARHVAPAAPSAG